MDTSDVTIIGGGPVGLFAAALLGLHGLRATILESLPQLGGQLTALYPEKQIYDVAGFPAIAAADLAQALIDQAMRYSPAVHLGATAQSLEALAGGGYLLRTADREHRSPAVLIAGGIGAFTPRRLPSAGAERFEGRGIYYVPPAMRCFQGQDVVVVGGGDTAVDWAREISIHARRVVVVHRRSEFRAQSGSVQDLWRRANVEAKTPYEVREILGEESLEGVVVQNAATGERETLAAQAIVSGLGFHAQLGPLSNWGLRFEGHSLAVDPSSMQTNLPGVFAAGDIAWYPGKVKLIATGFGEVGIAAGPLRTRVHPHLRGALPHSTNLRSTQTADPV